MEGSPELVGIEIGGTKLQVVVGNQTGRILKRLKLGVDKSKGATGIRQQIQKGLPKLLAHRRIQAVGVGFGGPVEWRTGCICRSHQIEGWSGFELGRWLEELTGATAVVDNDANVAALGEAVHGAGRGYNPVFYVTLGSGVGGGLVVDGRIYHGASPGEAEIGHVRLDRHGTTVESRCSGWAVDAKVREWLGARPSSGAEMSAREKPQKLFRRSGPRQFAAPKDGRTLFKGGEARLLVGALQKSDHAAQDILRETAEDLAFGLSHVVHLFYPQIIVLGGGLSGLGEPLRLAVEQALRGFIMDAFAPGPLMALSVLGEDAVPVGALDLAKGKLGLAERGAGSRGPTA